MKNLSLILFICFALAQNTYSTTFITEHGFKNVWLWQLSNATVTEERGISLSQETTNYYKSPDTLWIGKNINNQLYLGTAETATLYQLDNNYHPTEIFVSSNHSLISSIVPENDGLLVAVSPDSCLIHLDNSHQVISNTVLSNTYIWDIVPNPNGGFDILTGLSADVYTYNDYQLSTPITIKTEDHLLKGLYVGNTLWVLGEKGLYKKINNQFIAVAMIEGDASSFIYTNDTFYIAHTVTIEKNIANNQQEQLVSKLSSVSAKTGLVQEIYSATGFYFTSIDIFDKQVVLGADQFYVIYDLVTKKSLFSGLGESKVLELFTRGQELIAVTGNSLWGISKSSSSEGSFMSEVYDAGNTAIWGEFVAQTSTPSGTSVRFFVQGGVTKDPEYWSDWVAITNNQKIPITSARYLRYKAVLSSSDSKTSPYVHTVKFPYTQLNLPPIINTTKISLEDKNLVFSWSASDPNQDSLEYTIFLAEDGMPKIKINEQTNTNFTFSMSSYPSGMKNITLIVSDRPSNSDQTALTSEHTSLPVLFDGEVPVISDISVTKQDSTAKVSFSVTDKHSIITSVNYILNGKTTVKLIPVDGIFDSLKEDFSFEVPLTEATFLQISVRDASNNRATKGTTLLPKIAE